MSNPQNTKSNIFPPTSSSTSTSQNSTIQSFSTKNNSTPQPSSSSATNNTNNNTNNNNIKPPSKYRLVKDGWGTRSNFQLSYGLGLTPEGFEEGNRILAAFQEDAVEEAMEEQAAAEQEEDAKRK
ncbi:MAG: hypothetical protein Q9192_009009 [Flavoplaca navasiana]